MIDYAELIPEQEEELPESWLCDMPLASLRGTLPAFRVEDECFDCGDSAPLNFD